MTDLDDAGVLLQYDLLSGLTAGAELYRNAEPFPHIVIDNFLASGVLRRLLDAYPADQSLPAWNDATHKAKGSDDYVQKEKRNIRNILAMPAVYRQLIWELQSLPFLQFLSSVTGIEALLPDPMLRGAGIHQIATGGFLKVHADFTLQRDYNLERRLNLLLYLNENWDERWGGHLELWDSSLLGPPKKLSPIANRCVIFSTSSDSFHGHPHPLASPAGTFRKSIALYYYTNTCASASVSPVFSTDWRDV